METQRDKSAEHRYELLFPRTLTLPLRAVIWLRGYFDARRGVVRKLREGYISSPYCKQLVNDADYRLNAEYQECNGIMFELRPKLTAAMRERNELKRQLEALPAEKECAMNEAKIKRSGDALVSNSLAEKRANRRTILVEARFSHKEAHLQSLLNESENRLDSLLAEYQDCRDVADLHERIVRADYIARLSAYARGASKRIDIGPSYINDRALSDEPARGNDRFFSAYMDGQSSDRITHGSSGSKRE